MDNFGDSNLLEPDKLTSALVLADEDKFLEEQLKEFASDPRNPLYEDFRIRVLLDDNYDLEREIKYSKEMDPKNPLFNITEMADENKDRIINELIRLYKGLHIEMDKGIPMRRSDKHRLKLLDQVARKNIKTRKLAVKLFESYQNKKDKNIHRK